MRKYLFIVIILLVIGLIAYAIANKEEKKPTFTELLMMSA